MKDTYQAVVIGGGIVGGRENASSQKHGFRRRPPNKRPMAVTPTMTGNRGMGISSGVAETTVTGVMVLSVSSASLFLSMMRW